jgi:hypothetical protein
VSVEIVGDVAAIELIAIGRKLRRLKTLRTRYGKGRWRKLKGTARVRLDT